MSPLLLKELITFLFVVTEASVVPCGIPKMRPRTSSIVQFDDVVSVSCFGVRFSVMFHFMFVHYTYSSVCVAEWPPFGK